MINTSGAKWDFSKTEKFAVEWFNDHGFEGEIVKQYLSKTVFKVFKDGVTDTFELSQDIAYKDIERYMNQFAKNWEVLQELRELRKK